jgi:hypothetical protein
MILRLALMGGLALAVLAMTVGMVALLVRVLRLIDLAAGPDESDPGPAGGSGGHGTPSRPSDPGGEPAWWPEFERRLADHVVERTALIAVAPAALLALAERSGLSSNPRLSTEGVHHARAET